MNRGCYAMSSRVVKILSSTLPGQMTPSVTQARRGDAALYQRVEPPAQDKVEIRAATLSDYKAVMKLIDDEDEQDYLPGLYKHLVSDPDNYPLVSTWDGDVRVEPPAQDKVEIRAATLSDYKAVMKLIDDEDEQDYLPGLYKHLVSDPDNYPLVSTWDGDVVGFGMASILDGQVTGLGRAMRVHKDFRNLGIFKRLSQHMHSFYSQHFPQQKYETYATMVGETSIASILHAPGFKPVCKRVRMKFYHPQNTRSPETKGNNLINRADNPDIDIRKLTRSDLSRLFQAHDVCNELIPHDRLIKWYVGYRLLEDNLRHMVTDIGGAFASFSSQPGSRLTALQREDNTAGTESDRHEETSGSAPFTDAVEVGSHLDEDAISRLVMLTFNTVYPTRYGAFCCLDLYARQGVSLDHLKAHLQRNLEILRQRFPDKKAVLALTFDPSISSDFVTSCLAEHGIVDSASHRDEFMTWYERPLHF